MAILRMLGVLTSLLAVFGCGGQVPVIPTAKPVPSDALSVPETSTKSRIAKSYMGPKIRVAVGEFKELDEALSLYREMGWSGIAPGLTDQITTGLVQTNRVAVLERQQIKKVIGNLVLEKESPDAKYFNQKTTKKTGKLLGAQAILVGAVTEFEPDVSGADGGFSMGQLGGLRYHTDKAVVSIDVRLVDQETGKILAAARGRGEIHTSTVGGTVKYQGLDLGGQAWKRTPLGEATRAAAKQALATLVSGLEEISWEGHVVGGSGKKCFISAGKDLNLKVGDQFELIRRGKAILSEDGSVMGHDETRVGRVKLISVQKKMSIGQVVEGGSVAKGMIVRLPDSP